MLFSLNWKVWAAIAAVVTMIAALLWWLGAIPWWGVLVAVPGLTVLGIVILIVIGFVMLFTSTGD